MAIPTNAMAGPAIPVIEDSTHSPQALTAIPVYHYTSAPTDGRMVQAGAALRVKVIQSSDLIQNGGTYELAGVPLAFPVMVENAPYPSQGNAPIAVYYIN